jgi:hypothetical protein
MYQRRLSLLLLCGALLLTGCAEDDNPPRIILVSPLEGSDNGSRDAINIQFNEQLDPDSIDSDAIVLLLDGQEVEGTTIFQSTIGDMITFFPDRNLRLLTSYDATFSSGVTDLKGNEHNLNSGRAFENMVRKGWEFTVRDGAFGPVNFIESRSERESSDGNSTSPQVTIDSNGNALFLWMRDNDSNTDIWGKSFRPTDSRSQAENRVRRLVSDDSNTDDATAPHLAVTPNGNGIAVWVQSDRVNSRTYDFGTDSWTNSAVAAIDNNSGTPTAPQIAMDGAGNAIAVWAQANRIYASRFTAGGSWGAAVAIDDNVGSTANSMPQIAIDGAGDAIAVWAQSDGTRTNIWANRFTSSAWGTPVLIETSNEDDANTPQLAMNAAGEAIAIWSQTVEPAAAVTITIASPGVVSLTAHGLVNNRAVVLETTGSLPTGLTAGTTYYVRNATADSFELAATSGGTPINTSGTQSGTHSATAPRGRIYVSHFTPGVGTWGAPEALSQHDGGIFYGDASTPDIAMDSAGNALAVWSQLTDIDADADSNDDRAKIYASRFTAGDWGSDGLIAHPPSGSAPVGPKIAMDVEGNAICVFSVLTGTRSDIASTRFRIDPPDDPNTWQSSGWRQAPMIIESDSAEGNTGNAFDPQIALAPDLSGIAVWSKADFNGTGSQLNIQANNFD